MNEKKEVEPAIIWKVVTCQQITSKKTRPRWIDTWACDTVRWYWSADTLFDSCRIDPNIDVQYQFSCASKLARKCEIEHWLPCGADGRASGVRSRDYQIFWDGYIYLAMGLRSRFELSYELTYIW